MKQRNGFVSNSSSSSFMITSSNMVFDEVIKELDANEAKILSAFITNDSCSFDETGKPVKKFYYFEGDGGDDILEQVVETVIKFDDITEVFGINIEGVEHDDLLENEDFSDAALDLVQQYFPDKIKEKAKELKSFYVENQEDF